MQEELDMSYHFYNFFHRLMYEGSVFINFQYFSGAGCKLEMGWSRAQKTPQILRIAGFSNLNNLPAVERSRATRLCFA
jgi:hypothetical protein